MFLAKISSSLSWHLPIQAVYGLRWCELVIVPSSHFVTIETKAVYVCGQRIRHDKSYEWLVDCCLLCFNRIEVKYHDNVIFLLNSWVKLYCFGRIEKSGAGYSWYKCGIIVILRHEIQWVYMIYRQSIIYECVGWFANDYFQSDKLCVRTCFEDLRLVLSPSYPVILANVLLKCACEAWYEPGISIVNLHLIVTSLDLVACCWF